MLKKWSWTNLRYYSGIYLEGLRRNKRPSRGHIMLWRLWVTYLKECVTKKSRPILTHHFRIYLGKTAKSHLRFPVSSHRRISPTGYSRMVSPKYADKQYVTFFMLISFLFTLQPWRSRRQFPPKRHLIFTEIHGVISQKKTFFVTTGVRSLEPRKMFLLWLILRP